MLVLSTEFLTIVNSLYCGHPRDRELVALIARVRNSGNLFQSNVCTLFLPGIKLLSVLSRCPYKRGVRKARVDFKGKLNNTGPGRRITVSFFS